jgi:hypothetical protein
MNEDDQPTRRVRIEQGIYLQASGKHAVCFTTVSSWVHVRVTGRR